MIIAASVDVQNDCLFVDVKGYSYGGATWTIDFFPIKGTKADFNGPWDELDKVIGDKRYIRTDGKIYRILITLIDSGHNAEWVYAFAQRHSSGVYACKGKDWITQDRPISFLAHLLYSELAWN